MGVGNDNGGGDHGVKFAGGDQVGKFIIGDRMIVLNPMNIFFSQQVIYPSFNDFRTFDEALNTITLEPVERSKNFDVLLHTKFPAIRVTRWKPKLRDASGDPMEDEEKGGPLFGEEAWFSCDNRRLHVLQRLCAELHPLRCGVEVYEIFSGSSKDIAKRFRTRSHGNTVRLGTFQGMSRNNIVNGERLWDVRQAIEHVMKAKELGLPDLRAIAAMDCASWSYKTPDDKLFGPFSMMQMREWYKANQLPKSLPIRRWKNKKGEFTPISDFFHAQEEPFASVDLDALRATSSAKCDENKENGADNIQNRQDNINGREEMACSQGKGQYGENEHFIIKWKENNEDESPEQWQGYHKNAHEIRAKRDEMEHTKTSFQQGADQAGKNYDKNGHTCSDDKYGHTLTVHHHQQHQQHQQQQHHHQQPQQHQHQKTSDEESSEIGTGQDWHWNGSTSTWDIKAQERNIRSSLPPQGKAPALDSLTCSKDSGQAVQNHTFYEFEHQQQQQLQQYQQPQQQYQQHQQQPHQHHQQQLMEPKAEADGLGHHNGHHTDGLMTETNCNTNQCTTPQTTSSIAMKIDAFLSKPHNVTTSRSNSGDVGSQDGASSVHHLPDGAGSRRSSIIECLIPTVEEEGIVIRTFTGPSSLSSHGQQQPPQSANVTDWAQVARDMDMRAASSSLQENTNDNNINNNSNNNNNNDNSNDNNDKNNDSNIISTSEYAPDATWQQPWQSANGTDWAQAARRSMCGATPSPTKNTNDKNDDSNIISISEYCHEDATSWTPPKSADGTDWAQAARRTMCGASPSPTKNHTNYKNTNDSTIISISEDAPYAICTPPPTSANITVTDWAQAAGRDRDAASSHRQENTDNKNNNSNDNNNSNKNNKNNDSPLVTNSTSEWAPSPHTWTQEKWSNGSSAGNHLHRTWAPSQEKKEKEEKEEVAALQDDMGSSLSTKEGFERSNREWLSSPSSQWAHQKHQTDSEHPEWVQGESKGSQRSSPVRSQRSVADWSDNNSSTRGDRSNDNNNNAWSSSYHNKEKSDQRQPSENGWDKKAYNDNKSNDWGVKAGSDTYGENSWSKNGYDKSNDWGSSSSHYNKKTEETKDKKDDDSSWAEKHQDKGSNSGYNRWSSYNDHKDAKESWKKDNNSSRASSRDGREKEMETTKENNDWGERKKNNYNNGWSASYYSDTKEDKNKYSETKEAGSSAAAMDAWKDDGRKSEKKMTENNNGWGSKERDYDRHKSYAVDGREESDHAAWDSKDKSWEVETWKVGAEEKTGMKEEEEPAIEIKEKENNVIVDWANEWRKFY